MTEPGGRVVPAEAAPVLAARSLDYSYPGGIPALRRISLTVERGSRFALLGPNGCGKTTLFLHLNGTLRPQAGQIELEGRPGAYDRRGLAFWRSRVGLVLQDPEDQLFAATVGQDVSFGPLNLGLPEPAVRARVAAALAALEIQALADRPTHMLSFGQRRRVAIAGILAMEPAVVLLDEPMAGLDPEGRLHLLAALDRLHRAGTTLVLSTHDVDFAYAWADSAALLRQGRVLGQGPAPALLADRALMQQAGLRLPLVFEMAAALAAAGWPPSPEPPPRTRDELLHLIGHRAAAVPLPSVAGPGGERGSCRPGC